jgi:hypothetical protein
MNFEIAPKSTEIEANWDDARLYCFALNIDGKTGWRLPTKEELTKIYQAENDFEEMWYWSGTEFDVWHARCVNFYKKGNRNLIVEKDMNCGWVRAIISTI